MNQDYIQPDNWSIIEEGFDVERVKSSESLFSIGNGAMGQRANFEEHYLIFLNIFNPQLSPDFSENLNAE